MVTVMGVEDVVKDSNLSNYENKFLILDAGSLKGEYKSAKYQLFFAKSGFGCEPNKLGTGVFGYFCADGEFTKMARWDFLGIATDEAVKSWIDLFGEPIIKE